MTKFAFFTKSIGSGQFIGVSLDQGETMAFWFDAYGNGSPVMTGDVVRAQWPYEVPVNPVDVPVLAQRSIATLLFVHIVMGRQVG